MTPEGICRIDELYQELGDCEAKLEESRRQIVKHIMLSDDLKRRIALIRLDLHSMGVSLEQPKY